MPEVTPIVEAIQQLGLPEGSQFLGYVVHLPDSDEFLASFEDTPEVTKRSFSQSPLLAKRYGDYHQALGESQACKQHAEPWLLFDTGDQLVVTPVGE